MKKIIVFSLLTISLYASIVVSKVSIYDLTYVIDSTNTVCTKLPDEIKTKLFNSIKRDNLQTFKTVHSLGSMVEIDVNLDGKDYHIITFSSLPMCRAYQEIVLAGKYTDNVINYINN